MTKQDLSDLLVRVEGATAETEDTAIRLVLHCIVARPDDAESAAWWGRVVRWLDAGAYESAALALVTRVLPGWGWSCTKLLGKRDHDYRASLYNPSEAVKAAGLPASCKAHGLRKAASVMLAEAGCTAKEIMAITGHANGRGGSGKACPRGHAQGRKGEQSG